MLNDGTSKITTENTTPKNDTENTSTPSSSPAPQGTKRCKPRLNLVELVKAAELVTPSRSRRTRKQINYADMNTGIDSEMDKMPPRKKKQNVVASLREPSLTVLEAHQQ